MILHTTSPSVTFLFFSFTFKLNFFFQRTKVRSQSQIIRDRPRCETVLLIEPSNPCKLQKFVIQFLPYNEIYKMSTVIALTLLIS